MSVLQPVALSVAQARRTLALSDQALLDQWRDVHALSFEHAYLSSLDVTTARLQAALTDADRSVDTLLTELRALGGNC